MESSWASHPWVVRDGFSNEALLVVVGSQAVEKGQFYSMVWNSGTLLHLHDCVPAVKLCDWLTGVCRLFFFCSPQTAWSLLPCAPGHQP